MIYIGVFSRYCTENIITATEDTPEWEFAFVDEDGLENRVRKSAHKVKNVYYVGAFSHLLMLGFLSLADVGFCFNDGEQPLKLKKYGAAGLPIVVRPGEVLQWYDGDELVFNTRNTTADLEVGDDTNIVRL